jgi:hypothetical protein
MAYYDSQVRVATTKEGYNEIRTLVAAIEAKKALAGEEAADLFDELDEETISQTPDYVIFGWDYIDWFDDSPWIRTIIDALEEASKKYPVHFVRVGEEPTDIEDWDTDLKCVLPELHCVTYIAVGDILGVPDGN